MRPSHTLAPESSTPFLPFDQPGCRRRRHKRMAQRRTSEASLLARQSIKDSRRRLDLLILEAISQHGPEPEQCFTAREILRALKAQGHLPPGAERNSVSPRLSALLEDRCVENPLDAERTNREGQPLPYLKRVEGDAVAMTWKLTPRGAQVLELMNKEGSKNVSR
jgi:hypothetical protein